MLGCSGWVYVPSNLVARGYPHSPNSLTALQDRLQMVPEPCCPLLGCPTKHRERSWTSLGRLLENWIIIFFSYWYFLKGKPKVGLCHRLGYTWLCGSEEPCAKVTGLSSAVTRRDFLAFIKKWLRVEVPALPSSSKINPVLWLPSSQCCLGES